MKVGPGDDPQKYLDKLNKGLRDQILMKKAEIENVKELYQAKLDDQKLHGEKKLYQQHDLNQLEVAKAIEEKESRLEHIREKYDQTIKALEAEKEKLQENHENKNLMLANYREGKFQEQLNESQEETFRLRQQSQEKLNQLRDEKEWKLNQARIESEREITQQINQIQQRQDQTLSSQSHELRRSETEYKLELDRLKLEHERNIAQAEQQNQLILESRQQELEKELKESEQQFEHLNEQKQSVLQNRYDQLIREHEELMETTKARLDEQYHQLVDQLTSNKELFASRAEDPFYRIQTIDPIVQDHGDSYIVQLQVPEHERENVRVSPNGRQLKVTMTRNFSNRLEQSPGNISSSKRSEIFSRLVNVPEIMNPRDITQRYQDGILEFQIKKA